LHKDIEKLLRETLVKIPDVTVTDRNPKIIDTFQMNPDKPYVARARAEAVMNEEGEPALHHQERIIAMPHANIVREYGTHYGDLKIICSFPGDILREMIIDVTVRLGLDI
jgi:hypothetical protein